MVYRGPAFLTVVIWLTHTPPQLLSPVPATYMKTEKERLFADGRGGKGVGEEPNHTITVRPQENLALYISFNPLCVL
jgi:hypothetical protein